MEGSVAAMALLAAFAVVAYASMETVVVLHRTGWGNVELEC